MKYKFYEVDFYEKANIELVINNKISVEYNKFIGLSVNCTNSEINFHDLDYLDSIHYKVDHFIIYVNDKIVYSRFYLNNATVAISSDKNYVHFTIKENKA